MFPNTNEEKKFGAGKIGSIRRIMIANV